MLASQTVSRRQPAPMFNARHRSLIPTAALVLTAALAGAQPAAAESRSSLARGPFANFGGAYRGSGVVIGSDGHRERISCRANASVAEAGRMLTQNIVCASDSYKFDIRGRAIAEGGAVHGQWQETTRGVSGEISGRVSGGHFTGGVSGGGFNAAFSLHNNGRRLNFALRPQGGDVARVDVALSR